MQCRNQIILFFKKQLFLNNFLNLFIYLLLAVLGFHCCVGFTLLAGNRGSSLVVENGL